MAVERKPSFGTPSRRYTTAAGDAILVTSPIQEPRPHTRLEDESGIEKKYVIGEELGKGAFGVVREIRDRRSGQQYAMKIVNKDKPGSSAVLLLEREVEVLKIVNHPHIIKLEEVLETPKKMYLILELCRGGELSARLRRKGYFREEEAKIVMRRLTEAVVYMHVQDMVHRDLKLENVLISTADPTDEYNIKVTDFGLVHMKSLPGCDEMYTRCGTLLYMAPEVLKNKHEYSKLCDVWSLGVILYTLLCGRFPFSSDTAAKLEEVIASGKLTFSEIEWINVSDMAQNLIRALLCVDTTKRYTARRILEDPWITGQPAKNHLTALDLMRDITLRSEGEESPIGSKPPNFLQGSPTPMPRPSKPPSSFPANRERSKISAPPPSTTYTSATSSSPAKRSGSAASSSRLRGQRSTSASCMPSSSPSNLKFPSTSSISAKSTASSKQRSMSTSTRPQRPSTTSYSKRTSDRKISPTT